MFQLRKWSKKTLTQHDFKFAISDDRKAWNCVADRLWNCGRQAAKSVVADMLEWELFRDLINPRCIECRRKPFLGVEEHRERIANVLDKTTVLKPAQIEPLSEIALADAVKRNEELTSGVDAGVRVHAFEIEWDEKTDLTVQRFRNWLLLYKRRHDPRSRITKATNAAGVPEMKIQCGIAELKESLALRGRLRYDSLLRALAVRRLKQAGYKRSETEKMLGLKQYALNPRLRFTQGGNQWNKLPKLAQREIESFVRIITPVYALG